MTGALRGDHADIDIGRRSDVVEANVEAVREEECVACLQVRLDRLLVEPGLNVIRRENHDDVSLSSCRRGIDDAKTSLFRLLGASRARAQTDANVDAGVAETHRMGVALAAEADDGNDATLDDGQIGIAVVEQLGHGGTPLDFGSC